jgi:hypothetical protein
MGATAQSWIETSPEAKPYTRWWWLGSAVDSANLSYNLQEYARAGIGGVEITPIYGVQGNDKNDIPYLSPKWMEALEYVVTKGRAEGIETNKRNFTRFLIVADPWTAEDYLKDKTVDKASVVFTLPHDEGALAKVLSVLWFYHINLTKIQSLPIVGREWEYQFYINLTFSNYLSYSQAMDAIRPFTKDLRVLGEYQCNREQN